MNQISICHSELHRKVTETMNCAIKRPIIIHCNVLTNSLKDKESNNQCRLPGNATSIKETKLSLRLNKDCITSTEGTFHCWQKLKRLQRRDCVLSHLNGPLTVLLIIFLIVHVPGISYSSFFWRMRGIRMWHFCVCCFCNVTV